MAQNLVLKIRQMHLALDDLTDADLSNVKSEFTQDKFFSRCELDFNQSISEAELANAASLLIGNIASLKDHLKVWCDQMGVPYQGDSLINSNTDVAIVHDLWNLDKHAELNRKPRSGRKPRLVDLAQRLKLKVEGERLGSIGVMFNPQTGIVSQYKTGGGTAFLVIDAAIVDENGLSLGDLYEVCERAASAWEVELTKAGVPIPPR